jgi:hypothetical protein
MIIRAAALSRHRLLEVTRVRHVVAPNEKLCMSKNMTALNCDVRY